MKIKITYDNKFHNHPINANKKKNQGCIEEILEKIESSFNSMLEKHSKVLSVRFDIRYPKDSILYDKNKIYDFNYNLKRSLSREKIKGGHKVDPFLISVAEKHNEDHNHYHYFLIVNGNAHKSTTKILEKANRLWSEMNNANETGLVDFCNRKGRNGIMIDKNSDAFEKQYNEAFYQASYLAKVRGKENSDKGSWRVKKSR